MTALYRTFALVLAAAALTLVWHAGGCPGWRIDLGYVLLCLVGAWACWELGRCAEVRR